jgi:hypothetical protein
MMRYSLLITHGANCLASLRTSAPGLGGMRSGAAARWRASRRRGVAALDPVAM